MLSDEWSLIVGFWHCSNKVLNLKSFRAFCLALPDRDVMAGYPFCAKALKQMSRLLSWPIVFNFLINFCIGSVSKLSSDLSRAVSCALVAKTLQTKKFFLNSIVNIALYSIKMYSFSPFSLSFTFFFCCFLFLATFLCCPCSGSTCPSCVAHLDVGPTSAPERPPTWHPGWPHNRAPP